MVFLYRHKLLPFIWKYFNKERYEEYLRAKRIRKLFIAELTNEIIEDFFGFDKTD